MVRACFRIDDKHPLARIAALLRGEVGGGEFPLAGAGERIVLRVPGEHRLALREAFCNRAGDGGIVRDVGTVEPNAEPLRAQGLYERVHARRVEAAVADKHVVFGHPLIP